jgi:hypothetical protein
MTNAMDFRSNKLKTGRIGIMCRFWYGQGRSVEWLAKRYNLRVPTIYEILCIQYKLPLDNRVIILYNRDKGGDNENLNAD